ncbi:MAG: hypothetical protein WDN29_09950 [Methylovirgula sp.]
MADENRQWVNLTGLRILSSSIGIWSSPRGMAMYFNRAWNGEDRLAQLDAMIHLRQRENLE